MNENWDIDERDRQDEARKRRFSEALDMHEDEFRIKLNNITMPDAYEYLVEYMCEAEVVKIWNAIKDRDSHLLMQLMRAAYESTVRKALLEFESEWADYNA